MFQTLATVTGIQLPWTSDGVSNALLDVAYHSFRSGDKLTSPMFDDWLVDGLLTETNLKTLLSTVYTMYKHKWDRLYKLLKAEYNPIENYNGTETETTTTSNRENMGSFGQNTSTAHSEGSTNAKNSLYAYATTSTATPSDESEGGNEQDGTTAQSTVNNSLTASDGKVVREFERAGNMGTTTTQSMINEEIATWQWLFFETVFADLDKCLVLSVY